MKAAVVLFVVLMFCGVIFAAQGFPNILLRAAAGLILFLVLRGYTLAPLGSHCAVVLPAISGEGRVVYCGESIEAAYPQQLLFRLDLCRLWVLAIPVIGALVMFAWSFVRTSTGEEAFAFGAAKVLALELAGPWLLVLASRWIYERALLHRGGITLGMLRPAGSRDFAYEFMGIDGIRGGGMYRRWPWHAAMNGNMTPVLVDPSRPEAHLPVTGLVFYRFVLAQRRQYSSDLQPEPKLAEPTS